MIGNLIFLCEFLFREEKFYQFTQDQMENFKRFPQVRLLIGVRKLHLFHSQDDGGVMAVCALLLHMSICFKAVTFWSKISQRNEKVLEESYCPCAKLHQYDDVLSYQTEIGNKGGLTHCAGCRHGHHLLEHCKVAVCSLHVMLLRNSSKVGMERPRLWLVGQISQSAASKLLF